MYLRLRTPDFSKVSTFFGVMTFSAVFGLAGEGLCLWLLALVTSSLRHFGSTDSFCIIPGWIIDLFFYAISETAFVFNLEV